MENRFYISVAGLTVEMNFIREHTKQSCEDYLVQPPQQKPDIIASTSEENIAQEMKIADYPVRKRDAEQLSLFRDIAERAPDFGSFLFHGASISYDDKAYLFGALSGTGKTTHIKLWMKYLGERVQIVNGDKPLLRVRDEGVEVCSTPWAGKEKMQRNCIMPLQAICLLQRGTKNTIERVAPKDYMNLILQQIYMPRNAKALEETFVLLDRVLQTVPVYLLHCDMSEDAVRTSFPALTGLPYPER